MLIPFLKAKIRSKVVKSGSALGGVSGLLTFLDETGLYPQFQTISEGVNEAECVIDGKPYALFCANNYLGLSGNTRVKQAAKKAIDKYGLGPGGSRLISGNIDVIEKLEAKIADMVGAEDCLTFPTGYMANIAVFQTVMDPLLKGMPVKSEESAIFSDEYNHGSIVDGCRLSKAKKVIFKHNDLEDLRKKIRSNGLTNKLIVTEGVFSTEGEVTDIRPYSSLAKECGALMMVDDAHGIGILGKKGGGVAEAFGAGKAVDIWMGSLDKAFGGTGGYLAGSKELVRYLKIASRSFLLSSALPAASAAAMLEAADIIQNDAVELRKKVFTNAKLVREGLQARGFKILGKDQLPAIPLFVGDERLAIRFCTALMKHGIFTAVFRWPAVPEKTSRLRITVMASHTSDHIRQLIEACTLEGKNLGII